MRTLSSIAFTFFIFFLLTINLFAQDVQYEIINDERQRGVRRSVDVRLEVRTTEVELRELAFTIRALDNSSYPRTFILYYLPGMKVDAGAWASTHFRPDLEIRIYGMTKNEYERINRTENLNDESEVIGIWLNEMPYLERRITILNRDDDYFLETLYPDGSGGERPLIRDQTPVGIRFRVNINSEDFYLLRPNGQMELRDSSGLITILTKVQ